MRRLYTSQPDATSFDSCPRFFFYATHPASAMSLSLGALTTAFSPSPSCLATTNIWQIDVSVGNSAVWYDLLGPPATSDCLPSNYNGASTAYYSPGRCPTGYTAVKSESYAIGTLTETREVCCPTYVYRGTPGSGWDMPCALVV